MLLERVKRAWPHVVAAFVLFHVAAHVVDVVPDVSLAMNRKAWSEPRVREELTVWAQRLGVDKDALEDDLWAFGTALGKVRAVSSAPFAPYLRATGQRETWAMFVAGTRYRDRFQVRARACPADEPCAWEVLYDRGDDAHAFLRDTLEDPRVRSATFRWGWPQAKGMYQRGCNAIAQRALAARADVVAVQCRFERSRAPGHDTPAGKGEWGREIVVPR